MVLRNEGCLVEEIHLQSGSQISRMFRRLRMHGLIKKVRSTYKYYLTHLGQKVANTALKLRTMLIIPSITQPATLSV